MKDGTEESAPLTLYSSFAFTLLFAFAFLGTGVYVSSSEESSVRLDSQSESIYAGRGGLQGRLIAEDGGGCGPSSADKSKTMAGA